jgi:hypothetical protein
MTEIDGHRFYGQNFGRGMAYLSTSDPTWQILRGRSVTSTNGRGSKPAQSSSGMYMGRAQQFGLFIIYFLSVSVSYMGQSPTFQPFFIFCQNIVQLISFGLSVHDLQKCILLWSNIVWAVAFFKPNYYFVQ